MMHPVSSGLSDESEAADILHEKPVASDEQITSLWDLDWVV